MGKHTQSRIGIENVAIADHENLLSRFLGFFDIIPIGRSLIPLSPRSPMDCDRFGSRLFCNSSNQRGIDRLFVPPSSDLDCNRNFDSPDDCRKNFSDQVWRFQHPRSASIFRHLVNGTAAIEVQDVKAQIFNNSGCCCCHFRLAPAKLSPNWMHRRLIVEKSVGMGVVANKSVDLDHLAVDDPGPILARHLAEREIGTACKGGI